MVGTLVATRVKESAVSKSGGSRLPWEYADGPTVGEDIPITSPPREEERPGVPKPPPGSRGSDRDRDPERSADERGPAGPAGSGEKRNERNER